jgi:hypothetical protein
MIRLHGNHNRYLPGNSLIGISIAGCELYHNIGYDEDNFVSEIDIDETNENTLKIIGVDEFD